MGARRYQELACWQLARELKCAVFAFLAQSPAVRDRNFCDDIRASSRSAAANMAEGFGRETHRAFAHFLAIARGSLIETHNHLVDAADCGYLGPQDLDKLVTLANRAIIATTRLQSYLLREPDTRRNRKR